MASQIPKINPLPSHTERLKQLRALFPEVFSEGKLDLRKFEALFTEEIQDTRERFNFEWAGKQEALRTRQLPSLFTFAPDRAESVNFDQTHHVFIEGENLEALKLLLRPYHGAVKMIYIDPPYNTGNDFVYRDDYSDTSAQYLRMTGQVDENGNHTSSHTESNGRYHSAWLSMMYPRLSLARELLREDGVIFVSIDDHEVHHLRVIMDEIFGDACFLAQFIWKSRQNVDSRSTSGISTDHEYVLAFGKSETARVRGQEINKRKYTNPDNDPRGPWMSSPLDGIATKEQRPNLHYTFSDPSTGIAYNPSPENGWRFQKSTMEAYITEKRLIFPKSGKGKPRVKRYLEDLEGDYTGFSSVLPDDIFTSDGTRELRDLMGFEAFKFPKPPSLIKLLAEQTTTTGDIILDFFGGSGTLAQAVLELNAENGGGRQLLLVQLPEKLTDPIALKKGFKTVADIAKERIRHVIAKLKAESEGILLSEQPPQDLGFRVFKLIPSHFWQWQPTSTDEEFEAQLTLIEREGYLLKGWQPEPLLIEIGLSEGLGLTLKYEVYKVVEGCTVYRVFEPDTDKQFYATLDEVIPPDLVKQLGLTMADLLVCRDHALDDVTGMNFIQYTRLKTI